MTDARNRGGNRLRTHGTTIRMTEETYAQLRTISEATGRTVSDTINELIVGNMEELTDRALASLRKREAELLNLQAVD